MTSPPAAEAAALLSVSAEFGLLADALGRIPEFRKPQGKLHPLPGTLALGALGLMAGGRSLGAIVRFGRGHPEVLPALGLRGVPSVPTLSRMLAGVRPAAVREALRGFARAVASERRAPLGAVATDGKTLRGVHDDAEPALLLHLFAQQGALVLDQVAVGPLRDEVRAAEPWIAALAHSFPGRAVLTADALYADRGLRAAIVAQEYAYLIRRKTTNSRS